MNHEHYCNNSPYYLQINTITLTFKMWDSHYKYAMVIVNNSPTKISNKETFLQYL